MENEKWIDISGYEGIYKISSNGRVKSIDKMVRVRGGSYRLSKGRILKPQKNGNGYLKVILCDSNSIQKQRTIHRLVAENFITKVNGFDHVNHIDGNKSNNKPSNLEWSNKSENAKHAYRLGLSTPTRGEKSGMSKLTESEVIDIKKRCLNGEMFKDIASDYSVSGVTISLISRGKRWAHVLVD